MDGLFVLELAAPDLNHLNASVQWTLAGRDGWCSAQRIEIKMIAGGILQDTSSKTGVPQYCNKSG